MTFGVQMDICSGFRVGVKTTENRGMTPEEVSSLCCDKLIAVSEGAHPAIREQALAFRNQMEAVITHYMKQAVQSDRTTVYNALVNAGHQDLADLIRRL